MQIYKRGRITHWVDGRDPQRSNWLRFINCAESVETQNMTAFQSGGDIYYRTVQAVKPDTELLVWYGDDYASELGLISVSFTKSLNVINLCKNVTDVVYSTYMIVTLSLSVLLAFSRWVCVSRYQLECLHSGFYWS